MSNKYDDVIAGIRAMAGDDTITLAHALLDAVDQLRQEALTEQITAEISETFRTLTPDFVYDSATGVVVSLSARAIYRQQRSKGYRHTQRYVGTLKDFEDARRELRAFMERVEFGGNVYEMRKILGIKRKYLAPRIGVSKLTIRQIEYGEYAEEYDTAFCRTNYLVEKIAEALDSSVDTLWPVNIA